MGREDLQSILLTILGYVNQCNAEKTDSSARVAFSLTQKKKVASPAENRDEHDNHQKIQDSTSHPVKSEPKNSSESPPKMSAVAADIYSYLQERGTSHVLPDYEEEQSDDDDDNEASIAPSSPSSDGHSTADNDDASENSSVASDDSTGQTQASDEAEDSEDDTAGTDNPSDDETRSMTGLEVFKKKSSAESGVLNASHTAQVKAAKQYEIEVGITMCTPEVIEVFKAQCRQWSKHPDGERHVDAVFRACGALQFEHAQEILLEYLEERQMEDTFTMKMPATWNMSNEDEIMDAVGSFEDSEDHFKIHKIFAQMNLFSLVQSKQRSPGFAKGKGTRVAEYKVVLHEMSRAGARGRSDEKKKRRQAKAERAYAGGQRWHSVCEWFGGPGTVLVFVTAGILFSNASQYEY